MRHTIAAPIFRRPLQTTKPVRAIESMARSLVGRNRSIRIGFWALGCDGYPIVAIGDSAECHADAMPSGTAPVGSPPNTVIGGTPWLLASPIHGVQIPISPLQGRGFGDNLPDMAIETTPSMEPDHGEPAMAWPVPEFVSEALGYLWKPVKAVRVHD